MRAAIIDAPGNVRVGSLPDPAPKADELVIRVGACGICGTDLHIVDGDSPLACYPVVPGHEFAGEVVAMGRNVPQGVGTRDMNIAVGARVAVDPTLNCGHCEFCRTGRENLCLYYAAIGVTVDGACAEYVTVPANIDTGAMLTTALSLEDFPKALDMVRQGEGVKTQILPDG